MAKATMVDGKIVMVLDPDNADEMIEQTKLDYAGKNKKASGLSRAELNKLSILMAKKLGIELT